MSYQVSYDGFVRATDEDNIGKIDKIAEDFYIKTNGVYVTKSGTILEIGGWENYNDSVWAKFLSKIKPYINEGEIDFKGEDDSMWRFRFITSSWYEEQANIVYDEKSANLIC